LDVGADQVSLPPGATVFDSQHSGIANLDPALLAALQQAAGDAMADGATFHVTSGWRTPAHQAQLLADAVATYGSEAEAARWVAPPKTSHHVLGQAVDLEGPAADWLAQLGASYGLCQVYDNEPWHYELRPAAPLEGCPARYADPTEDPRLG
jgi:LAS superfamily LD-carboxypeptidase LdcB